MMSVIETQIWEEIPEKKRICTVCRPKKAC